MVLRARCPTLWHDIAGFADQFRRWQHRLRCRCCQHRNRTELFTGNIIVVERHNKDKKRDFAGVLNLDTIRRHS